MTHLARNRLRFLVRCFCLVWPLTTSAVASEWYPIDGDTLHSVHVLCKWPASPGAVAYQLRVIPAVDSISGPPFSSLPVIDLVDSTLITIVEHSLAWSTNYIWKVRPIDAQGDSGLWSSDRAFHIADLPSSTPDVTVIHHDSSRYYRGLTIFGPRKRGLLIAWDMSGNPVWFADLTQFTQWPWFKGFLPDGNILTQSNDYYGIGAYIISLEGDVSWTAPWGAGIHHDIIPMPEDHFLGITFERRAGYIPEGPWKQQFDDAGIDSMLWRSDRLVEWDFEGNEVWSWSCFDHFSPNDWDSVNMTYAFGRGYFDWTHSNAVWYDPVDNALYLSVRHLDRITKIDHATGQILWNMGRDMPSGQVHFGTDLGFSWQHAVKMLDNRNLILFDNGSHNLPPRSRGMEIMVTETDTVPTAQNVWEYTLPESMFCYARGDCDRLPNGNTLITASLVGQILEVTPDSGLVWQFIMEDQLTLQQAERVPGLYPLAFSVVPPSMSVDHWGQLNLTFPAGPTELAFTLHNEGWMDAAFVYTFSGAGGHFDREGVVTVPSGEREVLIASGMLPPTLSTGILNLVVTPEQAPAAAETVSVYLASEGTDTTTLPQTYNLHDAIPNPFNKETRIGFDLPEPTAVELRVYDIEGREIAQLAAGQYSADYHFVVWDGSDNEGKLNPSGLYIARLITPRYTQAIKMLFLK